MLNVLTILTTIFLILLIAMLFGGFTGWVVGLFRSRVVDVSDLTMWQIGATLGFFRTTVSN